MTLASVRTYHDVLTSRQSNVGNHIKYLLYVYHEMVYLFLPSYDLRSYGKFEEYSE